MGVSVWNVPRFTKHSQNRLKLSAFVELNEISSSFAGGHRLFSLAYIKIFNHETTKNRRKPLKGKRLLTIVRGCFLLYWYLDTAFHRFSESWNSAYSNAVYTNHSGAASGMLYGRLLSCPTPELCLIIASPFRIWRKGGMWDIVQLHSLYRPVYVVFQPFSICDYEVAKRGFLVISGRRSPP